MTIKILIVGSKPRCWHQAEQTAGVLKGAQPAQQEWTCWSGDETSLMCPRSSCVCLCIGEVVGDACFRGVQRVSVGRELGPFPYSADGAGEGNHSLLSEKNVLLLNSHFVASTSPLQGVFRQNEWITKHCVSSWRVWGAVTAAGQITRGPELFLIPHFTLMSCHRTQVSSLQPGCHVRSLLGVVGDVAAFRGKIIISRLQPLDSARRRSQKSFHSCGRNWI